MGEPGILPFAVLISGRGSNLAALIDATRRGRLAGEIRLVISDRPAAGLEHARRAGIPSRLVERAAYTSRAAFETELAAALTAANVELIVLAGFMRVLSAAFCRRFAGRMINLHPSLLPKYRGLDTHRRALAAGDAWHGTSVHLVNAELDGGPLIAQAALRIESGDDPERLAARLAPLEHRLLVAVTALIAARRLILHPDGVRLDDRPLTQVLSLDQPPLSAFDRLYERRDGR